jgi:hypothetical protein
LSVKRSKYTQILLRILYFLCYSLLFLFLIFTNGIYYISVLANVTYALVILKSQILEKALHKINSIAYNIEASGWLGRSEQSVKKYLNQHWSILYRSCLVGVGGFIRCLLWKLTDRLKSYTWVKFTNYCLKQY